MPQIINHVQPGLTPIVPKLNPVIVKLVHLALPLLMRFQIWPWLPAGIKRIEVVNEQTLAQCYQQFQAGQTRLILAFRHVEVDDPLCALHLLSRSLPAIAKANLIRLKSPLHAHFLYDRGMPLWGGKGLGWMLSRFGGVSLHRGKRPDWQALRTARDLVANGAFPFAVAPEGATNGHSELIGPLEPGVAQLGFWCVEDLQKANRPEQVWILPIGIQYSYIDQPWPRLDQLMTELETTIGLNPEPISTTEPQQFYERLLKISETLIIKLEQFYQQFYPGASALTDQPMVADSPPVVDPHSSSAELAQRLQILRDRALKVAESYFNITTCGTPIDRCRRLEEASWTFIHRSDLPKRQALPWLDRGLADWIAQEASLRIIHMRLAESFVAVTGNYIAEKPSFDRLAETTLLMFDAMARIRGDKLPQRPKLGLRQVRMTVTEPISISDRGEIYQANRRSAKQAIVDLTEDIRRSLESCISSETHGGKHENH
jgi:1-acyl-sn-glycerol-3-phosphate acyltransferase